MPVDLVECRRGETAASLDEPCGRNLANAVDVDGYLDAMFVESGRNNQRSMLLGSRWSGYRTDDHRAEAGLVVEPRAHHDSQATIMEFPDLTGLMSFD
ncbi:MAG TPA: hypothetical protein VIR27_04030 [Mycobacteriales bacterium]|jgi:hypothetical protein